MQTYFAKDDAKTLASTCEEAIQNWGSYITRSGLQQKWKKLYNAYYGRHWRGNQTFSDSDILQFGENNELSALTINDFRSLIKNMLVLTTNQKIAYDPRAANTDNKSLVQTRLAKNILDYYTRHKRVRRHLRTAAEQSLLWGKGFIFCEWDQQLGRPYDVEQLPKPDGSVKERLVYEGDVRITNPDVFSVYVDQSLEHWSQVQWFIVREFVNRFDMVEQYPDLAAQILACPSKQEVDGVYYLTFQRLDGLTPLIPRYKFIHMPSEALPNGRYLEFLPGGIDLKDLPCPYEHNPLIRIVPGEWYGSTEGYSESWDLLNLQQAENVIASSAFSTAQTLAVKNILLPEGANITPIQLGQGLRVIKYPNGTNAPSVLQMDGVSAESFEFLKYLRQSMETVFGVNSVARGNPEGELSGKAMGLLQSMAIQYASAFQESYAEAAEDLGTLILSHIKAFAKTQRVISIAGKFNKNQMVEFTGDDLSDIERVVVDLGNPMSKTLAGRLEIARDLLANGLIKNPQEYITVLETGNLETTTEAPEAQLELIRRETEALQEGKPVRALPGDAHIMHASEHLALLSDPVVRMNGAAVENILMHIEEHKQLHYTQDPFFSMLTGEPPPPPPPLPMGPEGPVPGGPEAAAGQPMPPEVAQAEGEVPPPPGPEEALQQSMM